MGKSILSFSAEFSVTLFVTEGRDWEAEGVGGGSGRAGAWEGSTQLSKFPLFNWRLTTIYYLFTNDVIIQFQAEIRDVRFQTQNKTIFLHRFYYTFCVLLIRSKPDMFSNQTQLAKLNLTTNQTNEPKPNQPASQTLPSKPNLLTSQANEIKPSTTRSQHKDESKHDRAIRRLSKRRKAKVTCFL